MRIWILVGVGIWLLCSLSLAQAPLHADRVVVLKKERTLQLLHEGRVIKSYKVALGGDPMGPKSRQGDHKTPEGTYVLDSRNAHSQFYSRSIFPIPTRGIAGWHARTAFRLVGTCLSTVCPITTVGSERRTG